jgi:hypothetical protein
MVWVRERTIPTERPSLVGEENVWFTIVNTFHIIIIIIGSLGIVVGIATAFAGRPLSGSSSPCRVKNFHFSFLSRPALGSTQSPIQWEPGALSPGLKRQGREDDISPPTSAAVKETDLCIHCPIRLHGVVLNYLSTNRNEYQKHKNNDVSGE